MKTQRMTGLLACVLLLLALQAGSMKSEAAAGPIIGTIATNYPKGQVPQYEKFEISFPLIAAFSNAFDQNEIDVEAYFTSPSGKQLKQPGFYYQDYSLSVSNEDDSETYKLVGTPIWKVRFAPREVGEYQYWISATVGSGITAVSNTYSFQVGPSTNPGFIRAESNQRYFKFDNGHPFIGIGLNVAWWESKKQRISTYSYYLDRMKEYGANLARVWMTNRGDTKYDWILSIQDKALGRDYNLDESWAFDQIVEMAHSRGIYFLLVLDDWVQYEDPNWADNLYNSSEIGCPCPEPGRLSLETRRKILSPAAMKYQQRVYRYIIARWGYSTSILGWEFFNEGPINEKGPDNTIEVDASKWYRAMATFVKTGPAENHQHLVNTSFPGNPFTSFPDNPFDRQEHYTPKVQEIFNMEEMDFAQIHWYAGGDTDKYDETRKKLEENAADTIQIAAYWITNMLSRTKPSLVGETGLRGTRVPSLYLDGRGVHLHNELWASLMSGMAAVGLDFDWTLHKIWDGAWWSHYLAISNYIADIDTADLKVIRPLNYTSPSKIPDEAILGTKDVRPEVFSHSSCNGIPTDTIGVLGLKKGDSVYAWIQNKQNRWLDYVNGHEPDLRTCSISVSMLTPGMRYLVEWWDTYKTDRDEQVTQSMTVTANNNGQLKLDIPSFKYDIAVKMSLSKAGITLKKTVLEHNVNTGGVNVLINTNVINSGSVDLENLTIHDDKCPKGNWGTLKSGAQFAYLCRFQATKDDRNTVLVTGTAGQSTVRRRATVFVYVADGAVGTGSPESCNEEALDTDLSRPDISVVTFNCDPRHKQTIYIRSTKTIKRSITFAGKGLITINAQHLARVFDVIPGASLSLQKLTIANGSVNSTLEPRGGGGIRNSGSLTISDTMLLGNSADWGGAIRNQGKLTMTEGTLLGNLAGPGDGGAIYNEGTIINILESTIDGNLANDGGGGGILNWGNTASVRLENSLVTGNKAKTAGGGIQNGWDDGHGGHVEVISSIFGGNKAYRGAGVFNGKDGTIGIKWGYFGNNEATDGGGILNWGTGTVNLTNVTLDSNEATLSGGAIENGDQGSVTIADSQIINNQALGTDVLHGGGAIRNFGGTVTLKNTKLANNSAQRGGGIYNFSQAPAPVATVLIESSTIMTNTATSMGGGILNYNTLNVISTTLSNNLAGDVPDGGGGIYNDTGTLTLTNVLLSSNRGGYGGGIRNENGTVVITDTSILNNFARFGGGLYGNGTITIARSTFSSAAEVGGGGINATGGSLTITNSTFSGNSVSRLYGGAGIYNQGAAVRLSHCTLANNLFPVGGAINNSSGTVTLRNSIVANNLNRSCSGAIFDGGSNLRWPATDPSCPGSFGDPKLGPLQNNGGPTLTMALLPGSAAVDKIPIANCSVATDQRGWRRPIATACDIGAFEMVPPVFLPYVSK